MGVAHITPLKLMAWDLWSSPYDSWDLRDSPDHQDGSAPTDAGFDPEPDSESGSSFDDPDPDPDYDDDDPDPHSDDDPNPEFVSDLDPDPDFDSDSGPDSGLDSDPNSYSTCFLCIFICTDYDF
ncbi:hypothetical protein L3X38_040760 [Prunus dulcis]|uniref:Uncharacterized protein n=1 Tax=Prunus dulcis TaxID=3755 RepID=A0AAD4YHR0_PRUDU|nr:hypothetical protein L3X38_040760 [Prunus dulcis]